MSALIWAPEALADVQRSYRFLAKRHPHAAMDAIGTIRSSLKTLESHPQTGRPAAEMPAEFREWLIPFGGSGYIVLYRFDGVNSIILAVRHQREAGY